MTLEPDPRLAKAVVLERNRKFLPAIPSTCEECGEKCLSKTALDSHNRTAHPKEPPFDDDLREQFLIQIRSGQLPNKTARRLGISPHTVKRAMVVDPSFAEALTQAEEEAAEEIEEVLRERALAADPWAVKEWLTKRSKSRWSEDKNINIHVQGEITHRADLLPHENDILALQRTIQERARLNGLTLPSNSDIIDAEIVE